MLKKNLGNSLNIFFANKAPEIIIKVTIAKLNPVYVHETSEVFNFKNCNMP